MSDDSTAPPRHPTLLHALADAARQGDDVGVTLLSDRAETPEEQRSYRALYEASRAAAVKLAEEGVGEGDRVLIVLPTSFDFITTFFAVELLGAVPVPSYPPAALERAPQAIARLRHVVASAGAKLCVTDRRLRTLLGELSRGGGIERFVTAESLRGGSVDDAPPIDCAPSTPAFIQYTSGSTDHPKGVLLSHHNLVANIEAMGVAMHIDDDDRGVSWLPLYHDMGLIGGLLTSVYWHMPLALMSPLAFMADPLRWLRTIDAHRATISPAPNFAYALCASRARKFPEQLKGLDLSTWRVAHNGAEAVSRQVLLDFQTGFGPYGFRRSTMLPVYGLAEVSLAASFPDVDAEPEWEFVDRHRLADGHAVAIDEDSPDARAIVGVGVALPGHELIVVDELGEELPAREVGHIVVRGPSVMQGYYGDPELTEEVLVDGTLWTGDLGYVSEGQLFVTGRAKDLVIVRGRNYDPADLERIAAAVPGVRGGGVVAFAVQDERDATEAAVMVCETRVVDEEERAAIVLQVSEAVAESSGVRLDEVVLAEPGTLPKTSSGKPQRSLTRDRYLNGELGREHLGTLGAARVFVRSGASFVVSKARRWLGPRHGPK